MRNAVQRAAEELLKQRVREVSEDGRQGRDGTWREEGLRATLLGAAVGYIGN